MGLKILFEGGDDIVEVILWHLEYYWDINPLRESPMNTDSYV